MTENNGAVIREEYKILRDDKKHHDMLIYHFLYFYFAIAPLFLLVGVEVKARSVWFLIFCILFDIILGVFTLVAIINSRIYWYYDICKAKILEQNPKFEIKHFSEVGEIRKCKKYGVFTVAILVLSSFLAGLSAFLVDLSTIPGYLPELIGFGVFIVVFVSCYSYVTIETKKIKEQLACKKD